MSTFRLKRQILGVVHYTALMLTKTVLLFASRTVMSNTTKWVSRSVGCCPWSDVVEDATLLGKVRRNRCWNFACEGAQDGAESDQAHGLAAHVATVCACALGGWQPEWPTVG